MDSQEDYSGVQLKVYEQKATEATETDKNMWGNAGKRNVYIIHTAHAHSFQFYNFRNGVAVILLIN